MTFWCAAVLNSVVVGAWTLGGPHYLAAGTAGWWLWFVFGWRSGTSGSPPAPWHILCLALLGALGIHVV